MTLDPWENPHPGYAAIDRVADRYAEACRRAAHAQGLDPITDAVFKRRDVLAARGIRYYVEQTGGFTMVACFYGNEASGRVVTVTWEGEWMAVAQPAAKWVDGTADWEDCTVLGPVDHAEDVVTAAIRALSPS